MSGFRGLSALGRTGALATTTATVILALGTGVSQAKIESTGAPTYSDSLGDLCLDNLYYGNCEWSHVIGGQDVAVGAEALSFDTTGKDNVANGSRALLGDSTGSANVADGFSALRSNSEGSNDVAVGSEALISNTTGERNVATGSNALLSNATGHDNVADGSSSLALNVTGSSNVAFGTTALFSNTVGENNIAAGVDALDANTEGNNNVAEGVDTLIANTTGSGNVAVGTGAGKNLTTGSNNIEISNEGTPGEEGTTRIGAEGKQTRAFIAGVYQVATASPSCAVRVSSEGQLGCNTEATETAIATFASRTKTLSGHCLAYTSIGPAGNGTCAPQTTGYSSSTRLAPTPANGATVTDLYADTSATVSGTDTVLVAVTDNTTGATLLSCTVTSASPHGCSTGTGSGSAAADDNIEVRVTANGASGNEKLWRVTFRF